MSSLGKDVLKIGTTGMIAIGGISGGLGAELTGGNFWQGFSQGLIVSALNHAIEHATSGSSQGDPPSKLEQITAEYEAMKARWAQGLSDAVSYASSSFDIGGLGVPIGYRSRLPIGYTGEAWTAYDKAMFKVKYFGVTLAGKAGYYTLKGLKHGGRAFTGLSVVSTVFSDQSTGWKAADLFFTGLGAKGGALGVGLSLGYSFNFKPQVLNPTPYYNMDGLSLMGMTYGYYLMSKK
jgi:hypothetical protein